MAGNEPFNCERAPMAEILTLILIVPKGMLVKFPTAAN